MTSALRATWKTQYGIAVRGDTLAPIFASPPTFGPHGTTSSMYSMSPSYRPIAEGQIRCTGCNLQFAFDKVKHCKCCGQHYCEHKHNTLKKNEGLSCYVYHTTKTIVYAGKHSYVPAALNASLPSDSHDVWSANLASGGNPSSSSTVSLQRPKSGSRAEMRTLTPTPKRTRRHTDKKQDADDI